MRLTGMTALDHGVGGTRITRSLADEVRIDFLLRAENMEEKLDSIVIQGGANDFGLRFPLLGEGEFVFDEIWGKTVADCNGIRFAGR